VPEHIKVSLFSILGIKSQNLKSIQFFILFMKVSVLIPTRNNAHVLEQALKSLVKQKPDEIIIIDGHSTDNTVEVVKKYKAKIVFESTGTRGGACNVGADTSKGDILAFTDDDCIFPEDWIKKIKHAFSKDVDVVGGDDIEEKNATVFRQALFQIDIAKSKSFIEDFKRLRGCNTAYRRDFFMKHKFNTKLTGIEETEMHQRMKEAGGLMIFDRNIFVYHKRRSSFRKLFRRVYTNGQSRTLLVSYNKKFLEPMDIIAPAVILVLLASIVSAIINPVFLEVVILTGMICYLAKPAVILSKTKNWKYYPLLIPILIVRELGFGLGVLRGFMRRK